MTKRERIEQRRIVLKAIRRELRKYAAAKRRDHHSAPGLTEAAYDKKTALGAVFGMKALAHDLGLLSSFGDELCKRIERRVDRVIAALPTRRPFRLVKTGTE